VTLSEGPSGVSDLVAGAAGLGVGAAEFGVGATGMRGALDVLGGTGADGAVVVGRTVVDGAGVVGLDGAAEVGDGAVAVGVAESVVCVAISALCACWVNKATAATRIARTPMLTTQPAAGQGGVGDCGLSAASSVDPPSGVVGSLISGSYGGLRLLAFGRQTP
jgi:hypothetical protein